MHGGVEKHRLGGGWWRAGGGVGEGSGCLDLGRLAVLLGLLGQQHRVDVGQHAARGNGDGAKQLGQLLVVADRQLDVTGDIPHLSACRGV